MVSWDEVLKRMKMEYVNILKSIYPSKGSTGFTERNLSVNFVTAYRAMNNESVAWYEFSFGKRKHFDALIIDPVKKDLIIVESKRFTNPGNKAKEIDEDIERIQNLSSEEELEKELNNRLNDDIKNYTIWGVIVADVWTENKNQDKKDVYDCFRKNSFSNSVFNGCERLMKLMSENKTANSFAEGFGDVVDSQVASCVKNNYKLLMIQWNVQEKGVVF